MALSVKDTDIEALIKQAFPDGMSETAFRKLLEWLITEINLKAAT